MHLPYPTDTHLRAIAADRHRAAHPLADLVARERLDLAPRGHDAPLNPRLGWRPEGIARMLRSLRSPSPRRPRTLTEECARPASGT